MLRSTRDFRDRPRHRIARAVVAALTIAAVEAPATPADGPASTSAPTPAPTPTPTARLRLVERAMAQDQGDWQVDYGFQLDGRGAITLTPADIAARVEGWLSNSRVADHAVPRLASCVIDGRAAATAHAEVIASGEESHRCRERVVLKLWAEQPEPAGASGGDRTAPPAPPAIRGTDPAPLADMTVEPGGMLRVRLRFEHDHCLYGAYDPLLGRRDLDLQLGAFAFRDALPLDREHYHAQSRDAWAEPTADRRDTRTFVSAPDSIHLEADIPGNQYIRFERKVRYGTRMRLRFWYLIASGTEGEFKARVAQYRESPNAWKVLTDGGSEITLKDTGRWAKFERIIRTEAEATTLSLDFRIANADIGEVWIDDISLEPVDTTPGGP